VREGISYSESAMRSGISISKQQSNRQIVNPSEIMGLADLEAYVRVLGGYPITKITFPYQKRNRIAESFILRIIDDQNFDEIEKLIQVAEKVPPKDDLMHGTVELIR
jgi:type IV secretory pathway TraG/TraD family ATPase VirD4